MQDSNFQTNIPKNIAILLNELGYFGSRKDIIFKNLDDRFEKDGWLPAWFIKGKLEPQSEAIKHYENSYFHFLQNNPEVLEWLVKTASDVYDFSPTNLNSRLDYSLQEDDAIHLQDIAVRRALKRLGKDFQGNHLVQIRGHESEGYVLNPGKVPFYKPELIPNIKYKGVNNGWWDENSVEAFYQNTKALVINPERLLVFPAVKGPEGIFFQNTKQDFYLPDSSNQQILWKTRGREIRRLVHDQRESYKNLRSSEMKPYSAFLKD